MPQALVAQSVVRIVLLQYCRFTHMVRRSKANCSKPTLDILPHTQMTKDRQTHIDNPDLPEHLQLLVIPDIGDPADERIFPSIQFDATHEMLVTKSYFITGLPQTCGCWQATRTSDAFVYPGSSSAAPGASSGTARLRCSMGSTQS